MTITRFAISLVLMAALGAAQTRSPEATLGAAIHIEEVQGNYPAAIEAYKKFLAQHGGNRALAAKAQLHLGICYEKVGDAEARKAYERVLAAYGDQKETAAQARARLGALGSPRLPAGFFQSQRILDSGAWFTGPPSRDGRYLPWGDSATGNLMLRDMTTGEARFLTHGNTNWADWIENAVISPDGKRLAYTFYSGADLFLVNLDGTGLRTLWKRTAPGDTATVGGWTPDGKSVVFLLAPENGQDTRVGVVDVGTGQTRMLAPIRNGSADRISLSPDGRYAALLTQPGPDGTNQPKGIVLFDVKTEQETPLVRNAVGGQPPVFSTDSGTLFFVSDRRGERDLYAIRLRDGKPLGPEEPVKIGIGDVRLSGFTSNGTLFYSQSIRLTDIFTVNYDPAGGTILEKPVKLPTRISGAVRNPRYSPDGKKLLYARGLDRSPWALVLRDLGSGQERDIPIGPPNAVFEWMPDSRQVLLNNRALFNLETSARSPLSFANGLNGQRVVHVIPATDANTFIVVLGPGLQSKQVRHKVVEYKLDSGATRDIYEAPADYYLRYSVISPDGKSLAVYEGEATENVKALMVIPIAGGKGHDLIREKGPYLGPAQWTADSKSVLVAGTFLGEKPAIWLFPAGPGEKPRKLLNFDVIGTQMSLHPDGRTLAFHSGFIKSELWTATNVLPPR